MLEMNRKKHGRSAKPTSRKRQLRIDLLEDRRLFAGLGAGSLEVLVFEDPAALRQATTNPVPAVERVVYVDLNRDGFYQSNEPVGFTDLNGRAKFDQLAPGAYSVRLLSNQRTSVQTTSNAPESAGTWTFGLGAKQVLGWESDATAWIATNQSIQKWNLDSGVLETSIDLSGEFVAGALQGRERGIVLVRRGDSNELVTLDLSRKAIETIPASIQGIESLVIAGGETWVRAASNNGSGLYRVRMDRDIATSAPNVDRTPEIDGFLAGTTVDPIGTSGLAVVDPTREGSRVSTYSFDANGWRLAAERSFDESVRFSNAFAADAAIAIETSAGVLILNNASGLPTLELLELAQGPTVFDASRGILISRSKADPSLLIGWSATDWSKVFEVPFTNGDSSQKNGGTQWSLGFLNDALVGIQNGGIYRHVLAGASAIETTISEGTLRQIAIGVRSRGLNRGPTLRNLPSFATNEDEPVAIPQSALTDASSDSEGDTLYYFVRSPGSLGRLQWSASSFGVFAPTADANGRDQLIVQAFDGTDWSLPQALAVQIRPVNDLPSALDAPAEVSIGERDGGAEVGRIQVRDVDNDAEYRYVVSDGRFVASNGILKLQPGVSLDYEASPILVLSVTATEVNQGDSVSRTITVHVQDRNDPPEGIVLTGNGAVPELRPGYVVGNIGVIDQDRSEVYDYSVSDPRFEVAGNVVRVKPGTSISYQDPGWIELSFSATSRSTGDTVTRTDRLRVIKDQTPYHNDNNPADVNGDGRVSPLDPLIIINYINSHGSGPVARAEGEGGGDLDVDGDGRVSPLDILIVINALNAARHEQDGKDGALNEGGGPPPKGEGEGEGYRNPPPAVIGTSLLDDELPTRRRRK